MTIEAMGLVEQSRVRVRVRVRQLKKVVRKRKCKSDARKTNAPAALQKLFITSRDVFKGHGTVPNTDHVRNLCRIIGTHGSFKLKIRIDRYAFALFYLFHNY